MRSSLISAVDVMIASSVDVMIASSKGCLQSLARNFQFINLPRISVS